MHQPCTAPAIGRRLFSRDASAATNSMSRDTRQLTAGESWLRFPGRAVRGTRGQALGARGSVRQRKPGRATGEAAPPAQSGSKGR